MRRCTIVLALFCLVSPVVWAQPPQAMISYQKLDNQAVVKMVHDGIPDEAIIQEIQTHTGQFDLSAESVASLQKAGASARVIAAMQEAAHPKPKPTASPAPTPAPPPPSKPAAVPRAPISQPGPRVYKADSTPAASSAPSPPPAPAPAARPPEPAPAPVRASGDAATSPSSGAAAPTETATRPAQERQIEYPQSEGRQETPKVELFGGFSITRSAAVQGNLNGWNAAFSGNVNRWFSVVADISKQSESQTFLLYDLGNSNVYLLMFGPQFSYRSGRFHGFGQGLFGTSHSSLRVRRVDAWTPAYGFGGGVDLVVASGFALRLLQFDSIFRSLEKGNRTDHRLSFGGVVRF